MPTTKPTAPNPRHAAVNFDNAGDTASAVACAWQALDEAPGDFTDKALLVRLLHREPEHADPAREAQLHALLIDPELDPYLLAPAGWAALRNGGRLPLDAEPEAVADWLEAEPFPRALLAESFVGSLDVEALFTRLRRWLLLEDRAADYPLSLAALLAQARLNGGAWLFDAEERARLDAAPGAAIAPAYRPPNPRTVAKTYDSPVTQAVAEQYASWPFPIWRRVMSPPGESLRGFYRNFGPGAEHWVPEDAEILVAGCGTGREALRMSRWNPKGRVTAIDISATSLAYAEEHCAANGATNIAFEQRDLHTVAQMGRTFDFISCCGVLHHLPDPEAGWAALTEVLRPGGVQRIMVYSHVARLAVFAARARLADLLDRRLDDDLLREARARLLGDDPPHRLTRSPAFFFLGGVHDLVLHRHEDPFTVDRIRRGIERQGLDFCGFRLPARPDYARYRREHPEDPWRRDYAAWAALERKDFRLFAQMYDFACRKPLA
ncbi:MAG: class I SAM-dependent methyltransferase [Pseudomonadota bacterium]